jgi:Ca2+-binding EF-hand superfamily protein
MDSSSMSKPRAVQPWIPDFAGMTMRRDRECGSSMRHSRIHEANGCRPGNPSHRAQYFSTPDFPFAAVEHPKRRLQGGARSRGKESTMLKMLSNRRVAGALIAGGVALAAGAVFADAPRAAHDKSSGMHRGVHRIFGEMDANHDGKVTRAEADAFQKARAAEIDANKDGKISVDEFKAFIEKQRDKRLAERLARMDRNGDGTVTSQEFEDAGMWSIARFDRNGDGVIDVKDYHGRMFHHAHDRMQPPRN